MQSETLYSPDETEIRQIIAEQMRAICAKDVDRVVARYTDDVVYYDCKPPLQSRGPDAIRRIMDEYLPCLPAACAIETRDLRVFVSGDLALAHWLFRFTGEDQANPALYHWLRLTTACQRQPGGWRIVHEHCSAPFDPETAQAVFALDA